MTIGDLIHGNFTWWQLIGEAAPLLAATAMAFWAGYERGRRVESEQSERILPSRQP
jgi:hypothetical protein